MVPCPFGLIVPSLAQINSLPANIFPNKLAPNVHKGIPRHRSRSSLV